MLNASTLHAEKQLRWYILHCVHFTAFKIIIENQHTESPEEEKRAVRAGVVGEGRGFGEGALSVGLGCGGCTT